MEQMFVCEVCVGNVDDCVQVEQRACHVVDESAEKWLKDGWNIECVAKRSKGDDEKGSCVTAANTKKRNNVWMLQLPQHFCFSLDAIGGLDSHLSGLRRCVARTVDIPEAAFSCASPGAFGCVNLSSSRGEDFAHNTISPTTKFPITHTGEKMTS